MQKTALPILSMSKVISISEVLPCLHIPVIDGLHFPCSGALTAKSAVLMSQNISDQNVL